MWAFKISEYFSPLLKKDSIVVLLFYCLVAWFGSSKHELTSAEKNIHVITYKAHPALCSRPRSTVVLCICVFVWVLTAGDILYLQLHTEHCQNILQVECLCFLIRFVVEGNVCKFDKCSLNVHLLRIPECSWRRLKWICKDAVLISLYEPKKSYSIFLQKFTFCS